jgi:hypothetical protein
MLVQVYRYIAMKKTGIYKCVARFSEGASVTDREITTASNEHNRRKHREVPQTVGENHRLSGE